MRTEQEQQEMLEDREMLAKLRAELEVKVPKILARIRGKNEIREVDEKVAGVCFGCDGSGKCDCVACDNGVCSACRGCGRLAWDDED